MKQKNSILSNFIYNLFYQVVVTILPLITIPYLSRVLGAHSLGIARYTESVVQLFTVFGLLGLVWYANRAVAYSRQSEFKLSACFWEIFLMRLILLAATLIVFAVVVWNSEYNDLYLIYSVYILGTFLDTSWFFIGIEEMRPVAIRNCIVRILSTILIFLFVHSKDDLKLYIWIISLTLLVNAMVIVPFLKPRVQAVPWTHIYVWRHFIPALSLFLPQAASQIYVQCDKLLIKHLIVDPSYISFYTENEKIAKMPIILASALSTVLMPRIAFEFKSGNRDEIRKFIRKAFISMLLILMPCCTGMMAVARNFVPFFLGREFAETYWILILFCPIMIFIGLSNVTGIQYLVALDRTRELTISYVCAAVVNLILDIILIPVIGVYGAIAGTLVAEALVFIIQYHYMHKDLGDFHMTDVAARIFAISVFMGILVYFCDFQGINIAFRLGIQVLIGLAVYCVIMLKTGIIQHIFREE